MLFTLTNKQKHNATNHACFNHMSLIWSKGEYKSRRLNQRYHCTIRKSKCSSAFSSVPSAAVRIPFSIVPTSVVCVAAITGRVPVQNDLLHRRRRKGLYSPQLSPPPNSPHLTNNLPTDYRQLAVCRLTDRYRYEKNCRPTVGQLSANCRPTVGQLSADCRSTVGRLSADSRPTVGQQSVEVSCSSLLPKWLQLTMTDYRVTRNLIGYTGADYRSIDRSLSEHARFSMHHCTNISKFMK